MAVQAVTYAILSSSACLWQPDGSHDECIMERSVSAQNPLVPANEWQTYAHYLRAHLI